MLRIVSMERDNLHPVERAIVATPWFTPGTRVLVAVSGGPDSMALLAALAGRGDVHVTAAHYDHGMRPASERDADVVRALADAFGIKTVTGTGNVPAMARSSGTSLEATAREMRYRFLDDAAWDANARWVVTAHTRSDQVETVLMRIARGAGARGLAGIPAERGCIVRPLLNVSRADTIDYCAQRGLRVIHDPSNLDRRFTRNAVRHDSLPELRRVFPGIDDSLLRIAANASHELARLRSVTDERLDAHLTGGPGEWVLHEHAFVDVGDDVCAVLLGDALARIGHYTDIRRIHYDALVAMTHGRMGASLDLPGITVRREHDGLVFRVRSSTRARGDESIPLRVPGSVSLGDWMIDAVPRVASNRGPRDTHVARGGETTGPVGLPAAEYVVRAPRPGDRIRPFGMDGSKKLSDVFIDKKVPRRERERCVVVEAAGEILWVPGVVASEATRVHGSEASIQLTARREEGRA
jgi:tRNA(Ile)-lysidine synthase